MNICDIHSHLLPGIDDGSDSWDTTMKMIRISWKSGVRKIIATPHNLPWEKKHNTSKVAELCREAERRARDDLQMPMKIYPGQEIFFHRDTIHDLDEGNALTLGQSNYVLVEFPENVPYEELKYGVVQLTRQGYQPILAHFERFPCLRKSGRVDEIRELGIRIQSNIHAMRNFGRFSADRRWLKSQYKNHKIDFIASDMHNLSSRRPIEPEDLEWYQKNLPELYVNKLFWKNAQAVLE